MLCAQDIQSVRGNWFEQFSLMIWAQGGQFDARNLLWQ